MKIKLYNTLTLKKGEFEPIKKFGFLPSKKIGIYTCGPTVYDYAHIGNLRAYIFSDILRRTLEFNKYKVNHVMNITDFGHLVSDADEGEDKMTKALRREGKSNTMEAMKEVADFYTGEFKKDIASLNIETPHVMPKATEHVKEDIEIIKTLEKKGIAYKTSDGIYFNTSKFKDYGKLGNINIEGLKEGARVEKNTEKKNVIDFALWKFNKNLGWDSPWGKGFPGWHIECSGMSTKYLGQPFDIHTGGIDHVPVHHQNEIAQSEAAYDKPLANYWMHGEFLNFGGQKMAKSSGGFITLRTIEEKGLNPLSYRYLVLTAHYRSPLNFTLEAVESAQKGLEHLYNQVRDLGDEIGEIDEEFKKDFTEKINDDLNTPQALAVVQEVLKSEIADEDKLATVLNFDKVLGLKFKDASKPIDIPQNIKELADKRQQAREDKNWNESDRLRDEIKNFGYEIEDIKDGYRVQKKASS